MSYGCGATLNGSPIGGGAGYLGLVLPSDAHEIVGTLTDLKGALASAISGQVIYVAHGATCLITDNGSADTLIGVKAGVILAAGKGISGIIPGCIRIDPRLDSVQGAWATNRTLVSLGIGAKLGGLHIWGPNDTTAALNLSNGVVVGNNAEVFNCDVHGFGFAGVYPAAASGAWIHHSFIHHCQKTGLGYGVCSGGTSGLVVPIYEGNLFENNRHHHMGVAGMASNGRYASFKFRYNLLGVSTNTQLDVHGLEDGTGAHIGAGDEWSFDHNTSTSLSGPFVGIRGIPRTKGEVKYNWTYLPENKFYSGPASGDPKVQTINEQMYRVPGYGYQAKYQSLNGVVSGPYAWVNMEVGPNWLGTTPPPSELRRMAVTVAVARR
jgi:hypothetical protein